MRMVKWALTAVMLPLCVALTGSETHARQHETRKPQYWARCPGYSGHISRKSCHVSRRPGLVAIPQVPGAILRGGRDGLDVRGCRKCLNRLDYWYWRAMVHARERRPDLVESLRQPPNAATAPVLNEAGIPVIADVPPIVIVQPNDNNRARIRAYQSSQQ